MTVTTRPLRIVPAAPLDPSPRSSDMLGLLAAGVPLTLLIDLAPPAGPDSRAILDAESVEVPMWRTA